MNALNLKVDVLDIEDQPDGSAIVRLEVNEDFVAWFNQFYGLQEFSQEKFEQWFHEVVGDYVSKLVQQGLPASESRT